MSRPRIRALFVSLLLAAGVLTAAAPVQAGPAPTPSATAHAPVKGLPSGGPVKGLPSPKVPVKGLPVPGGVQTEALTACPGGVCYDYAGGFQSLTDPADGMSADITISKPFKADAANNTAGQDTYHTLVEMSAQSSADGGTRDVVEFGWTVDETLNGAGAEDPYLFGFTWVDGTPRVYNGGTGYTDNASNSLNLGGSLAAYVNSNHNFKIENDGTAWVLYFDSTEVGRFDNSIWSPTGAFTTISVGQTFGEVADTHGTTGTVESCSDMGSGATAGTSPSTVIGNISFPGSTDTVDVTVLTVAPQEANKYKTTKPAGNQLRVGGPGADSLGVDGGTRDHCAANAEGTPTPSALQLWQEVCPDNSTTTGCNPAQAFPWSSQTIGVCTIINNPGVTIVNAAWNNSLSSGKTFKLYRTGTCGGTALTLGNAVKMVMPAGWTGTAVRAIMRTA